LVCKSKDKGGLGVSSGEATNELAKHIEEIKYILKTNILNLINK